MTAIDKGWALVWTCSLAFALWTPAALASPETRTPESFDAWRRAEPGRDAAVTGFAAHLHKGGLGHVLPLDQLMRSASAWSACQAAPFALPPPEIWPHVLSTLALLRELRRQGAVNEVEVHSGYRDATLNACAGGAARSAHLVAFALDFVPIDDPQAGERLCQFWRTQGKAWSMGLSRYPSGRVHIDTWRFRTWGADHTGNSAFCLQP